MIWKVSDGWLEDVDRAAGWPQFQLMSVLHPSMIALLVGLGLSPTPAVAATPAHECTLSESRQADKDTESLQNWDAVYAWFRRWSRCDDGGVAEGNSEAITVLLAEHWSTTTRLATLTRKDSSFADFVLDHVDETVPADRLRRISANARVACPKGARSLCIRIERAAQ